MDIWRMNVTDWNNVSESTAQLYLELAEKKLQETVETAKSITDKNDKVLAINVAMVTALLGYFTSLPFDDVSLNYIGLVVLIIIVKLIISICFLLRNLFVYKIGTIGEEPRFIMKSEFLKNYDKIEQYLNLAFHMCEIYQLKISENEKLNLTRTKKLTISIYIAISVPIAFPLAWVIQILI